MADELDELDELALSELTGSDAQARLDPVTSVIIDLGQTNDCTIVIFHRPKKTVKLIGFFLVPLFFLGKLKTFGPVLQTSFNLETGNTELLFFEATL